MSGEDEAQRRNNVALCRHRVGPKVKARVICAGRRQSGNLEESQAPPLVGSEVCWIKQAGRVGSCSGSGSLESSRGVCSGASVNPKRVQRAAQCSSVDRPKGSGVRDGKGTRRCKTRSAAQRGSTRLNWEWAGLAERRCGEEAACRCACVGE